MVRILWCLSDFTASGGHPGAASSSCLVTHGKPGAGLLFTPSQTWSLFPFVFVVFLSRELGFVIPENVEDACPAVNPAGSPAGCAPDCPHCLSGCASSQGSPEEVRPIGSLCRLSGHCSLVREVPLQTTCMVPWTGGSVTGCLMFLWETGALLLVAMQAFAFLD